ncbi:MAG TPA: hypothetical protein ENG03_01575 [Thioploca sp.]|nr:MAG: hypothetical protein B6247_01750 [Beggiatoa sp. 4572_84]RKZ62990.1 MAG: hypothetical protein DRR08_04565 [Gammaproteobacteria bacterium]HDN25790.1 hypothetical protein [Thioploca sp.]
MKTANTQILLKDWVNALFQAIAFCLLLLGSVGVGVAYAQEQGLAQSAGTGTPSHEIAFAKVSDTVDKPEKTAGCVIVWLASKPDTKHIYCRYELGKNAKFLRDNDIGINLSDVKLYPSQNQTKFEEKIQAWFKKKLKLENLAPNELQLIAELMSSTEETFSPNSLFPIQPPTRYDFVLPNSSLASNERKAGDKKLDYKTFAAEVHRSIPKKMAEIANKEASTAKQVAASQVTAADDKTEADKVDKKAAGEVDEEAADNKEAKETDDKANADTTLTDNKLSELEDTIAQLWFGIILVPVVILALLGFFLAKKNTHLVTELRNDISSALDEKIYQLQKQQQIEYKTTSQQHFDKLRDELKNVRLEPLVQQLTPEKPEEPAISARPSKPESEPTPPPRQSEVKAQLASSKRNQELEQEKNRLEHDLKTAQNQLSSEQEQREQTDKTLKETLDKLNTATNKHQLAHNALEGIRTQLNQVLENSQQMPEYAEAEKTLDGLKTVITQYTGEKDKREKADKVLKDIRTELNKVVKAKLAEDEDAEKTLESIQTGVNTVIRTLRTKDKELKTLTQHEQALQQDVLTALIREPLDDSKEWTEKRLEELRTEINQSLEKTKTERESLSQQYETEKTTRQLRDVALEEAQTELKTLTENQQTLQNVLHGRFRLVKPENIDFSHWTTALIEQQGTWRWAQLTLVGELLACETSVKQIKEQGDKKAHDILATLELDKPLEQWNTLVGHLFESDTQLWKALRDTDGGKWLNRLLRASDLLQAYFKQEQQFGLLSQHLSNVSGILQAVCAEMDVQLIKPQLLEKVPDDIPENNYRYTPYKLFKTLVKPQVLEKLKTVPKFVVDIETYGFVTADNPKPDVRVFVSSPAEWE